MLEYKLFQVEKRPFMSNSLTNLHERLPGSLSELRLTFDALLISNDEHYSEGLLEDRPQVDFFLDCQADFQSLFPKEAKKKCKRLAWLVVRTTFWGKEFNAMISFLFTECLE